MAQTNLLQNYKMVTLIKEPQVVKSCVGPGNNHNNCLSVQFRELVSQVLPVYKPWWGDRLGCIQWRMWPVGVFETTAFGPVGPSPVTYQDQEGSVWPLHPLIPHSCTHQSWVFEEGEGCGSADVGKRLPGQCR